MEMEELIAKIRANTGNYYEVLGVPKSATHTEIRRSYYKIVLKLHPDKNPGSRAADEACQEVMRAYEVLSDNEKRAVYDIHGVSGVSALEEGGGAFTFSKIVTALLVYLSVLILVHVARKFGCIEVARVPFGRGGSVLSTPFASADDQFAAAHAQERSKQRRHVRYAFSAVLVVLLLCSYAVGIREATAVRSARYQRTEAYRYFPLAQPTDVSSHLRLRPTSELGEKVFYVNLATYSLRSSHDATRAGVGSVPILRFGGTEAEALSALKDWVAQECPKQARLAWASRERFEATATLARRMNLQAEPSPNTALKRHFPPQKKWRPQFEDSFSVTDPAWLYSVSPLCQRAWVLHTPRRL